MGAEGVRPRLPAEGCRFGVEPNRRPRVSPMGLFRVEGLSRDVGLLLLFVSAGSIFGGLFGYVVQLYLKALGFDSRTIGLMSTVNLLSCMALSIPFGLLGDRYGRRNIMLLGCGALISSVNLLLMARETLSLFASFLLLGVGNSAFTVLLQPLYASHFEGEDMERGFGILGFLSFASNAVGGLLGYIPPILMERYRLPLAEAYGKTMGWCSLLLYLASAVLLLVRSDRPTARPFNLRLRSRGVLMRFSLPNALIGLAAGIFIELMAYYLSVKFHVESASIGTVYLAASLSGALANLAIPKLSRRLGTLRGILASLSMVLPLHLSVALAPAFPLAAALYIARAGVMNLSMTLMSYLMMRMAEDGERATVNSLVTLASMASRGVGTALGGTLMALNLDLPGYVSTAIYAASTASFAVAFRGMIHPSTPKAQPGGKEEPIAMGGRV